MSIIKPPFEITGSIRGISFYKQYGSDKVIMRTKGGATRDKIRKSPKFAKLRLHQAEWKGCVKMSGTICNSLFYVKHLADFNVSSYMNGFSKRLQALDTENPVGGRKIQLSAYKYLLDEFQLNRMHSFASILRISPAWMIRREAMEANVQLPYINTTIQLVNPYNYPYFRVITSLGIVSDMMLDPEKKIYIPCIQNGNGLVDVNHTEWYSTNREIDAQEVILNIKDSEYDTEREDFSLVLSIGVEFGKAGMGTQPEVVRHAGSARVLGVR